MARVYPYHTNSPEYPPKHREVYHFHDDCEDGKRIQQKTSGQRHRRQTTLRGLRQARLNSEDRIERLNMKRQIPIAALILLLAFPFLTAADTNTTQRVRVWSGNSGCASIAAEMYW